ncbi:Xaa-Pro peptidase family protein [Cytobacillus spongiae]|uniref:M24 family metallopeptidase n=1 Tax=Cytobacillus spongiae TaxID=2901381 RepID=UPI001F49044E|nr:Xaa-Pro peptidase family protein [Cytobacillus spongiae]UII57542.1 Xaa-Pro peptidase family protein [Cytobacillus spongiae]
MQTRLKTIREWMAVQHLDALWIHTYENRRYVSRFTGSNGYLFITNNQAKLITDQRYKDQAKEETEGFEVICHGLDRFTTFNEVIPSRKACRIGFEANDMPVTFYQQLSAISSKVEWVPFTDEFLHMRKIKDDEEIQILREAIARSDQAFASLLPLLKVGMTEKQVRMELEYQMAKWGNEGPAFGTIIASDIRAAFPHAGVTENQVKQNRFLLIDFGMKYEGYMSDMTRTIATGHPPSQLQDYYQLVLQSLEKSIEAIKPGVRAGDIDLVARQIFAEAGVEPFSLRGLGHGVGLQIHEYPRVVLDGDEIIQPGMVFTVEPGLYIPEQVGVRIEDIVLVTEDGCEVLTKTSREIQI